MSRGDTGGDGAHQRWLALVGAQTRKTFRIGAHRRWLAPEWGLISARSVIQLAGERWGKKWGKNMLHLACFV